MTRSPASRADQALTPNDPTPSGARRRVHRSSPTAIRGCSESRTAVKAGTGIAASLPAGAAADVEAAADRPDRVVLDREAGVPEGGQMLVDGEEAESVRLAPPLDRVWRAHEVLRLEDHHAFLDPRADDPCD